MREFLNILNNFNDEFQNKSHKFILDNIEDSQLNEYYLDMILVSKRLEKDYNSILYVFRENLKISNDILKKIFKIENLRLLHLFMQEILIKEIPICSYRSDVSLLILSFLDHFYNIFEKNKKIEKSAFTLGHEIANEKDDKFEGDIKIKKLFLKNEDIFHYELNLTNLEKLNLINPGELILEFLRYILNFITYVKIKFFEKGSSNSKYLDFFKSMFNYDYLQNEAYLFNIKFMFEYLQLQQDEFNQKMKIFLESFESIFFKICENSHKITNYIQIISNINKN